MSTKSWNLILKLALSALALTAALYVFNILKGNNISDLGVPMYGNSGGGGASGFFLLAALLVLANYIANVVIPIKRAYAILWIAPLTFLVYFVVISLF